jgi:hypothetical protein
MTSGNVTIKNNNYFDIGYGDLDCIVEFYNRNGYDLPVIPNSFIEYKGTIDFNA